MSQLTLKEPIFVQIGVGKDFLCWFDMEWTRSLWGVYPWLLSVLPSVPTSHPHARQSRGPDSHAGEVRVWPARLHTWHSCSDVKLTFYWRIVLTPGLHCIMIKSANTWTLPWNFFWEISLHIPGLHHIMTYVKCVNARTLPFPRYRPY